MGKYRKISTILNMLGVMSLVMGALLILPIFFAVAIKEYNVVDSFLTASLISLIIGLLLKYGFKHYKIDFIESLLICGLSWILLCILAALPLYFETGKFFLDCFFETVSGFTTTGITIYTNIEALDKSIILWRSFTQWLGGLGILTFFLAINVGSTKGHFHLLSAESHKIQSERLTPNIKKTAIILWCVYLGLSILQVLVLLLLKLSLFDAVNHTMTSLSTGGFSSYDASINHFRLSGYENYRAIEYTITIFMFLGGMNFLLHYKFLIGKFKEYFSNRELHVYTLVILLSSIIIVFNIYSANKNFALNDLESNFRKTIFTVVSIITTTGFGTEDINSAYFPAFAKQMFLLLMVIGGCVGSTAGGIKIQRSVILTKLFSKQIKKIHLPRTAISDVRFQGEVVNQFELERISGLFTGWLIFLVIGGCITSLFTDLNAWQSFSGMFSAMGNIGPCYFDVKTMSTLPSIVKIVYIVGMLAGRLEIIPILLIFSRKAWK